MANDYLGNLKFMGQDENKNFLVEVEIVRSGPNRNGWDFQNMETLCNTFLGTPLLCAYLPNRVGDGHNFREATLPTGEEVLDFTGPTAERIVGMISENPDDIWTEEREDGTWAIARGKIWRFYNRQLVDKLALQGGMAVSAEIETFGGEMDEKGIEVYTDWQGLGVTLLHESVPPAVPGAHIQAIRAMSEEFKEMKFKAASYHPNADEEQGLKDEGGNNTNEMNDKGVNHTMSFNRREAERLAPKFESYTIVGLSEDSKNVILMSETGGLFSYTFNEEYGEGVVAEAIAPVKNVSVMCGETPADLDEIVKAMSATISESKATITNLNARIETLNSENEAMKTAEHDRRIEMVKASVHKALEDIAESCDNAENCDNEAADIEANAEDYAQMESADGKFCGDKAAYEKLMSVFGKKVAKSRKANNAKSKAQFAWNMAAGKADEGGVASLVAKFNGVNQ
jgi:hypothetical protein